MKSGLDAKPLFLQVDMLRRRSQDFGFCQESGFCQEFGLIEKKINLDP